MKIRTGFWPTVRREVDRMASRKMYLGMMVIIPVFIVIFFVSLLSPGLPLKVPVAVVDLDHSQISRQMTRSLGATELLDIREDLESYSDAMTAVREGRIFGFILIPEKFQKNTIAGNSPSVEFYNNLTYFVPGTLTFKGFKTVTVTTAAGIVRTELVSLGLPENMTGAFIQPMSIQQHPIGNPWMNYSIYLTPSFSLGGLALMILLMSCFSITMEIKNGTSPQWLATARNHIGVAVCGKLFPHFIVWSVVGQFYLAVMFGWEHFPCGNILALCLGMELFILATQALGVLFCSIVPNPRMALTLAALIGILSFSFLGFSFPVQSMYGAISIFSYIIPTRYMFLIYIFSGLDAFPLYFSRVYFAVLCAYPLVGALLLPRLKKACLNPVYVP